MRKLLLFWALCFFTLYVKSQNKKQIQNFDEKAAIAKCISTGMKATEIKGYVEFLKNDFSSKNALKNNSHKHSSNQTNNEVLEKIIYLSPNKTASVDCPNMGFENYSFSGWAGGTGTISSGPAGSNPIYTSTGTSIINSAGNNVSLANTVNYQTLMTLSASNAYYPYFNGYDSLACKAIGSNTISEIPVVSPYSQDQVSVRMNGAVANYRASRLKYITTTSSTNKQLSFSCAMVLQNSGHTSTDAPYFKVEIKNETTGALLAGCKSFTLNSATIAPADSFKVSVMGFNDINYKKWQQYFVDLSSLPLGTNVSVSFEIGDCALGGHWGYAYVDAECGGSGIIKSNMCSGSGLATLVAPVGFSSYQWFDPSTAPISGAINNILSISNPTIGNIYSVQLTNSGGCVETQTVAITTSTTSINNITTTGSCPSGNSGSATVFANGSNGTYTYTWTSISTGSVVSNSQTASNLSPGNYNVVVSSGACGQASATVTVPNAPPNYSQQLKSFCGNSTNIVPGSGTNYQWYNGLTLITGANGTNDTLNIAIAVNGANYTVVYINSGSCKDSIKYVLQQIAGGYVSANINHACPGNTNGAVVLNLNTVNTAPYTFVVKDITGVIANSTTSALTYTVSGLGAGTYTSVVNDGNCTYINPFTINSIQTSFTMTGTNTGSCSPSDTARINFNFGSTTPANCNLSSSGNCSSPNNVQIGNGTGVNSSTSYPAIYSNWYKNARHQLLYTASELLAAGIMPGKISSLAFNIATINGTTTYPNFTIKMKCTSVNDLTGASFDNTGLTQVYFSSLTTISTGWNTYQFPVAYEWDGVSNILIDVCSDLTTNYTNNSSSPFTTTTFGSVLYFNSDVTVACMTTNFATASNDRPNIKFENCGSITPTAYTIAVSSNGTIVQNNSNTSIKVVPAITPTTAIVYTITVTNPQGGCTSSQTYTMSSNLTAVASATNASCGSCPNGSAQVMTNCGTGPYTYSWSPGGATTQSVSGLMPGCYTVNVTDANSNSAISVTCVSFATKLKEVSETKGFIIYPNPGNGVFNLLSNEILNKIDIIVFNPLGQSVFADSFKTIKDVAIDISKLSKGIYYLKATTDNGSELFKLILE